MNAAVARPLLDIAVLIADTDSFRRDYIAQVLRDAGATILSPYVDLTADATWGESRAAATTLAYIGCAVPNESPQALITALLLRGVSCIAVCTNATDVSPHPGVMVLPAPIAAFQVVHALVELAGRCAAANRPL